VSGEIVCRAIEAYVTADARSEVSARGLTNQRDDGSIATELLLALAYVSYRTPPWGGLSANPVDTDDADRQSHLVLVLQRGDLIAVHSTDDRVRQHLLKLQSRLELGGVGLLTRAALEEALLPGEIATFWMGAGAASRGRRGPRSKTTYGERLEETIDQVGDQRHTLSGARGSVGEDVLGPGRDGVIGVNLDLSGVWLRRADDYSHFVDVTDHILARISEVVNSGGGHERFVIFARYIDDLDAAEDAYDISFEVPGEQPGAHPSDDEIDAFDWMQSRLVSVSASGKRSASVGFADGDDVATFTVRPDRAARRRIEFEISQRDGDATVGRTVIENFALLHPRIYYGSGHTITGQGVIAEHFPDVSFGGWVFEALPGVDVSVEKPGNGTRQAIRDQAGKDSDRSLFGWIVRAHASGWLYCDDASDELCDFIEFDPTAGELAIWHVKACKSVEGRGIAAVPYEQVCSQVTKNTPTLSIKYLMEQLQAYDRSGRAGPLWKHNTPATELSGMIEAIQKPRASLKVIVRVLQPYVTEELLLKARSGGGGASTRGRQLLRRLDHLLIATDDAVGRLGARLEVVTATTNVVRRPTA